jgi:hypothetical protein
MNHSALQRTFGHIKKHKEVGKNLLNSVQEYLKVNYKDNISVSEGVEPALAIQFLGLKILIRIEVETSISKLPQAPADIKSNIAAYLIQKKDATETETLLFEPVVFDALGNTMGMDFDIFPEHFASGVLTAIFAKEGMKFKV